jgi:hypothetical protein
MTVSVPSSSGRRPGVVTVAGYLLFGAAALALVIAVLPLPSTGRVVAAAEHAYSYRKDGESIANVIHAVIYLTAFGYLLVALAFAVLARYDLRGHNGARIATWVVGGAGALCAGTNVLIGRLATGIGENGTDPQLQAAQQEVRNAQSYTGVSGALTVLLVLALVLVVILLVLPAASAYFQPPKPEEPEPVPVAAPVPPAQREQ